MHIEYPVNCTKDKFIALLDANTDSSYSIFPRLSKTFRGTIDGYSYNISYNSILKGIRPGVHGTLVDEGSYSCLLIADTYLQPLDLLITIIIGCFTMYFAAVCLMSADPDFDIVACAFGVTILLVRFLVYRLRRKLIINAILDLARSANSGEVNL
jgi:hypothetical protein